MTTQVPFDNVRAGLAKIRGALDWIDSKLPGVKIDGDHRHRIPAQLYDLELEHAASIIHLIDTCRYDRSEEQKSEHQALMRNTYAVFCSTNKKQQKQIKH